MLFRIESSAQTLGAAMDWNTHNVKLHREEHSSGSAAVPTTIPSWSYKIRGVTLTEAR